MERFYIGLYQGEWQVFAADSPEDATPEATGYEVVDEISFDTREEAEQSCAGANA